MVRHRKFRRRRGTVRRARSNKFTLVKAVKYFIFAAPQVATAINGYKMGGGGQNGVVVASDQLLQNFAGYSFVNQKFYTGNLARGYVPLFGAWLFGKVASRVLR